MIHMKVKWCLGFVLVIYLALIHRSQGESQVICPSQPIVATVGNDIIFLCRLEPPISALEMTVEWARPDLNPRFVLVWRDGVELESKKHLSFKGRTSVFIDDLEHGNISLKLSKVKLSDQGTYRCFIPQLNKDSTIKLDVGAVSSPVVNMTRNSSMVVLQCESKGWYPQPEVFWLDGEGNLLSAGPTETVRGPDGLYTVSSRVTVENKHSNNFTCKVQQTKINQIRETHIIVPDDFFPVPDLPDPTSSSSSFVPTIIGVIIGIVFILAVVFVVWKLRQNKLKNKKNNEDEETQRMRETSNSTSNDPEQESLIKTEKEREMMKNEDKKMNSFSEETKLQCETGKETHQRETNNVLVQTQEGTVQQAVNEVANLSVPVKEETDKLLKEGRTKTGLDKREKETEPTSKRAEATASAETYQQQSEQQSVNNDGEGQPVGIIAGEVKKNEEDEEKKRQSTTEAEKEKETEMDNEREILLKQLQPKEREEKAYEEKILKYNRLMKEQEFKINQLREQLEEVEKKLQSVNSEKNEMDAETQKVAAAAEEIHIKNDLERKKAELQKDLQKTEKALQRNKRESNNATQNKMKKSNEKKEIIEKLEEIEKQNTNQSDSDDDL
ncbi:selection and upkeep of intraepithelial T-cells protein 5-like [Scomber scombrus]|uniref:selection and upkeep of intraepithelial T-cells protein 5-like n=1 Tax=Scomber scombrus TaxID=13677 RepID=UPI002DDA135E|nr:selection and upkeep of intraepithelial T-cells protein 5-like [Scomber scombrus]